MKKHIKAILAPIIILATVAAFIYYIKGHPETLRQVGDVSPWALIILLLFSMASFSAYILITRITLSMYGKTMPPQESILFNIYSSLINFFGPGQSGPIFRAAYLKKRHNLTVKQFTFTLLLYLGFLAVVSAAFMFVGSRPWWQTTLLMLMAGAASVVFIRRYKSKEHIAIGSGFNPVTIGLLFGAVVLQLGLLAVMYGIELHQIGANPSVGQVLSYTGVSNFSIFVALTPGAIGIREGFLVFSQGLHHISTSDIVAANLLDRGAYLLFLGILAVAALSMHAKDKLHVKQLKLEEK
jgi:uncharacterized membrane protein YbhN (UPF0104 family)